MKQLKSSLGDLRRLFVRTITLRDIAEPLAKCPGKNAIEFVQSPSRL